MTHKNTESVDGDWQLNQLILLSYYNHCTLAVPVYTHVISAKLTSDTQDSRPE